LGHEPLTDEEKKIVEELKKQSSDTVPTDAGIEKKVLQADKKE